MPVSPSIDSSLGAMIIGSIFAFCLYGALCVQAYCYHQHNFNKDPFLSQRLMETIHTVFISITLYETIVTHFGDYTYFTTSHWPLSYSVPLSTFICAPVQTFYAFRVTTLSKKAWVLYLSMLASTAQIALSFVEATLSEKARELVVFQHKFLGYIVGALVAVIFVDTINTISLTFYLLKNKEMSMRSSKQVIDRLLLWTIGQ
ncbi:hypothetical protein C8R41DRAFT_761726 [Lentinula lateritia]|uniref:Uncharacterized protein n=1 Tax=Lentinula lateritia TaxID=40482 RepID=A0ABQ8VJN2_9AGAR|nr:hypothetical protein C8R41DRAFT_761726 [Lentinula lateritia]